MAEALDEMRRAAKSKDLIDISAQVIDPGELEQAAGLPPVEADPDVGDLAGEAGAADPGGEEPDQVMELPQDPGELLPLESQVEPAQEVSPGDELEGDPAGEMEEGQAPPDPAGAASNVADPPPSHEDKGGCRRDLTMLSIGKSVERLIRHLV